MTLINKTVDIILAVIGVVILFTAGAALFAPLVAAGDTLNSSGMPLGTLVAGSDSVLALIFAAVLVIGGIIALIVSIKKK
jgi:hypothetical protein